MYEEFLEKRRGVVRAAEAIEDAWRVLLNGPASALVAKYGRVELLRVIELPLLGIPVNERSSKSWREKKTDKNKGSAWENDNKYYKINISPNAFVKIKTSDLEEIEQSF